MTLLQDTWQFIHSFYINFPFGWDQTVEDYLEQFDVLRERNEQ